MPKEKPLFKPNALKFCLLSYCLILLPIVPQMSASWDELNNRNHAAKALRTAYYTLTGQFDLIKRVDRIDDHGPFYIGVLRVLESAFGLSYHHGDEGKVILLNHFVVYLTFALSLFFFLYLLQNIGLRQIGIACGLICLALHPRIFNHAFHNQYDIGFLAFCIITTVCSFNFIDRPNAKNAIIAGVITGMATDIRIVGIMFFAMTVGLVIGRTYYKKTPRDHRYLLLYGICTFASIYTFWPILWLDPFTNFFWALKQSSNIRWSGYTLFLGEYIRGYDVPWFYNPLWIAITTPLPALLLVILALAEGARSFAAKFRDYFFANYKALWLFAWILLPTIPPMLMGTTLFDCWRHHFFIYPALIALGLLFFKNRIVPQFRRDGSAAKIAAIAALVLLGLTHIIPVVTRHPFQALYFNDLPSVLNTPKNAVGQSFDVDYWGLSFRRGLETVAKDSGERNITVNVQLLRPAELNLFLLNPKDRKRITLTDKIEDPFDYFIGNYRFQEQEYDASMGVEFFQLSDHGTKFLTVRRSHKEN